MGASSCFKAKVVGGGCTACWEEQQQTGNQEPQVTVSHLFLFVWALAFSPANKRVGLDDAKSLRVLRVLHALSS